MKSSDPSTAATGAGFDPKTVLETRKLELEQAKLELEIEKNARSRWLHEDGLINHRLTWLLISQSLLFAAFGTLAKQERPVSGSATTTVPLNFYADSIDMIPYAGIGISAVTLIATGAACAAQWLLAERYRKDNPNLDLGVSWKTTILGWSPALLIPVAFLAAWVRIKFF